MQNKFPIKYGVQIVGKLYELVYLPLTGCEYSATVQIATLGEYRGLWRIANGEKRCR